jgi:formylglycine-generating enzyme required for sulfatase activity
VSETAASSAAIDSQFVEDIGNGVILEMAPIPGGAFIMGAPPGEPDSRDSERPQHRVTVPPFRMGRYAVTIAQWQALMGDLPEGIYRLDPRFAAGERQPVVRASWNDADAFCRQLSARTGRPYRLPAEAEWEYACRAGTTTPFWFGTTVDPDVVNCAAAGHSLTVPVGSLGAANPFGLFDMHGNVWEWCDDRWNSSYEGAPADGSAWRVGADARTRVLRGGYWASPAALCRAAARSFAGDLTARSRQFGFRIAMSGTL